MHDTQHSSKDTRHLTPCVSVVRSELPDWSQGAAEDTRYTDRNTIDRTAQLVQHITLWRLAAGTHTARVVPHSAPSSGTPSPVQRHQGRAAAAAQTAARVLRALLPS